MKSTLFAGPLLALALGSVACGGGALTAAGARVQLMKADPPPSCAEVGSVSAHAIGPNNLERTKNTLRNDAADEGATYVRLDTATSEGEMTGTAFRCPATALAQRNGKVDSQ